MKGQANTPYNTHQDVLPVGADRRPEPLPGLKLHLDPFSRPPVVCSHTHTHSYFNSMWKTSGTYVLIFNIYFLFPIVFMLNWNVSKSMTVRLFSCYTEQHSYTFISHQTYSFQWACVHITVMVAMVVAMPPNMRMRYEYEYETEFKNKQTYDAGTAVSNEGT